MDITESARAATTAVATRLEAGGAEGFGRLVGDRRDNLAAWTARALVSAQSGQDALRDLALAPRGAAQAEAVLAELIGRARSDAAFAEELGRRTVRDGGAGTGAQSVSITNGGVGLNAETLNASGATIYGGAYSATSTTNSTTNSNTRVTQKKKVDHTGRNILLGLAVVVVVVLLAKIGPAIVQYTKDGGITADSTCQQFLDADEQTEQQAMVDIADSKGIKGFGFPFALDDIRFQCSNKPGATVGSIIDRYSQTGYTPF
jgi:hypothetical protein